MRSAEGQTGERKVKSSQVKSNQIEVFLLVMNEFLVCSERTLARRGEDRPYISSRSFSHFLIASPLIDCV